ncbi:aminopeptidase M1 isoform X2 [Prunus yedoensis var. nudiflora]|uniref:Aminopeptidase M1 isoform X2 n=1 Tax=Prunus yedoensis var. nudiflora TaxID=2094558 RepID=A0A314ZVC8_PRUYE|nr:aminopeptidase M1 isoform X2 [Prunus yedoensis var. nudiflora]
MATTNAPEIIFLDEIDSLAAIRQGVASDRVTISCFLNWKICMQEKMSLFLLLQEGRTNTLNTSTYEHKGEKKNMAVTQFEQVDARRCFPCWHEPAWKATFKIRLDDVPSELVALSNMPVVEEKSAWTSEDNFISSITNHV